MPDASGYVKRAGDVNADAECPGLKGPFGDITLRKELGSWSDVTGSERCWNGVMVKYEILTKGGWGWRLVKTDIEADGVGSGKVAGAKSWGIVLCEVYRNDRGMDRLRLVSDVRARRLRFRITEVFDKEYGIWGYR
ncbi:Potassium Voltage-Gated Channel Subfamily H Member 1 [Manis pentadactyla]|nr:Potassium Voltage-Gated Channel Subfamily H Member 1 [Manis pentadactyla]